MLAEGAQGSSIWYKGSGYLNGFCRKSGAATEALTPLQEDNISFADIGPRGDDCNSLPRPISNTQ